MTKEDEDKRNHNQIGNTHINQMTIEINESLFSHLINEDFIIHERQVWVLGMKCRKFEDRRFFAIGSSRTKEILIPLIVKSIRILPNRKTKIYTDSLASYNSLSDYGYFHKKINHSVRFAEESIHKNHIESM